MMITFCSHCGSENSYKIKAPEICSTCKQSISGNLIAKTEAAVTPTKRKEKPKPEYKSRFKLRRTREDDEEEENEEGSGGEEVDLDAIYNYKASVQVSVDKNVYNFKDVIGTGGIGIDRGAGNDTNINKVLKDIAQISQKNSIDLE